MTASRDERITVRFAPGERREIEVAAERESVGASVVVRQGALLRARRSDGAMLLALEPGVSRRVRAAADLEDVEPVEWAVAVLGEVASRRLAGDGFAATLGQALIEREQDHEA